jgi:hypothetical protein
LHRSLVLRKGRAEDETDREELERRLAQAKRMAAVSTDAVTQERLQKLVKDLEEQLREPE